MKDSRRDVALLSTASRSSKYSAHANAIASATSILRHRSASLGHITRTLTVVVAT